MKLEVLISAVNADAHELIEKMKVTCDAVLINQCGKSGVEEFDLVKTLDMGGSFRQVTSGHVRAYSYDEKGVGVSRNHALMLSEGDYILFGDDDIEYVDGFDELVLQEFFKHPEADVLFFNFDVEVSRRTYWNEEFEPVTFKNSGRFPTYAIAARREAIIDNKITFSPLFGGGAKYSCGEDSLFIMDCLRAGLKCFMTPVCLGREVPGESTWFKGYNEKFFFDRGVLYHFLYGRLAKPLAMRFLALHKDEMCQSVSMSKAYKLMKAGIKEGKTL